MKSQRSNLCLGESIIASRWSQDWRDRTLASASEHQSRLLGLSSTGMHMQRLAWGHSTPHTSKSTNWGTKQDICSQGGCEYQCMEQLPKMRKMNKLKDGKATEIYFFKQLKSKTSYWKMGCLPESGRQRQKEGGTVTSICGTSLEAGEVPVDGRTNVTPTCNSSSWEDHRN